MSYFAFDFYFWTFSFRFVIETIRYRSFNIEELVLSLTSLVVGNESNDTTDLLLVTILSIIANDCHWAIANKVVQVLIFSSFCSSLRNWQSSLWGQGLKEGSFEQIPHGPKQVVLCWHNDLLLCQRRWDGKFLLFSSGWDASGPRYFF